MKTVSKIISLILVCVMMMSILAACGSGETGSNPAASTTESVNNAATNNSEAVEVDTSESGDKPRIAYGWIPNPDPLMQALNKLAVAVIEAAGCEWVPLEMTGRTAEAQIEGVQNIVDQGVDGVFVIPASDSVIPKLQQICEDAGVYLMAGGRSVTDPDVREYMMNSPYFCGFISSNDEETSYTIVKEMYEEMGATNMCVIAGPVGDTSSDARDLGIERAVEETGMKVLSTVRNVQSAEDVTKAVENFIAAFPELESIYVCYATPAGTMEALQKVLEENNLAGKIKVTRFDFAEDEITYFENGQFQLAYGGISVLTQVVNIAQLVNAVKGTPIHDGANDFVVKFLRCDNATDAADYYTYCECEDVLLFTEEEMKEMLFKFENPEVSAESIQEMLDNFSIASVKERRENLGN